MARKNPFLLRRYANGTPLEYDQAQAQQQAQQQTQFVQSAPVKHGFFQRAWQVVKKIVHSIVTYFS